jgi:hypothetical protein
MSFFSSEEAIRAAKMERPRVDRFMRRAYGEKLAHFLGRDLRLSGDCSRNQTSTARAECEEGKHLRPGHRCNRPHLSKRYRDMPARSKKQQMAAGAALAAKRGEQKKSSLKGASKQMVKSMSEKQLRDIAKTSRKKLPKRKK